MLRISAVILAILSAHNAMAAGNIRAQYNIENDRTEVAAAVLVTPFDKLSVIGDSGGKGEVRYNRFFVHSPKWISSAEVGYLSAQGAGDIAYARGTLIYQPIKELGFLVDHAESLSISGDDVHEAFGEDDSILEQRLSRFAVIGKPFPGLTLTYRFAYATLLNQKKYSAIWESLPNGGVQETETRNEFYASYRMENGFEPYVFVETSDIKNKANNIHLGMQYNF